ncbi:LacI family DNA-binding transcriptional regulator [Jannaschia sp. Os4]|uniref:LacI family DNA-binding transcriptional regulator n=1 Tax=Jannaschia sp. Os4 TaxID=2807617 RepID=UPI00193A0A32|nr:LacI family DNA-binding transcriptional regulator [Jannaschia sp. Os4]MBM2575571.1 LacI family DNA-binding transcriptional regulator [Jannaschia sp. Os4]
MGRIRNRPPGLREVAQRAGVSMMTVSRALRGVDGVSSATRARIAALAADLGYVPDGHARALGAADSRIIGISVPNLFNDVFAQILDGMRRTLETAGYSSVVDTTDYDLSREQAWCDRMAAWRPAALVLTGCAHAPALREALRATGRPVVELWDVSDDPIDVCVGLDHRAAGAALAAHVVALGHRRPAFVGPPEGVDPRADARFAGIAATFAAAGAGAPGRVGVDDQSAFGAGARGMTALLAQGPRHDVVFFHNDNTAFGGLMTAEAAGLRVPEDIGIAGFNGLDLTRVMPRPLTTLKTPRRQIGLVAGQHLLARLNGVRPPARTVLAGRLVPGATVAPQP